MPWISKHNGWNSFRGFAWVAALVMAAVNVATADVPAGGGLPTPGLGTGTGATSPYSAGNPAPASAVKVTSSAGWIDLPNITLNPNGDWAIFIATESPSSDHAAGTILSIGTLSNTLFADPGHLSLNWCGRWANPWSNAKYQKTFAVTGEDDTGNDVSARSTNPGGGSNARFFGVPIGYDISALVSFQSFGDNKPYGIVIQRVEGKVELWSVDRSGPRLMDYGSTSQNFGGITNKPFRLAAALMPTQPSSPATYWKYWIQGLVVYNGGSLTPVQMQRLYNGADARSVLNLQAARDDRYYPGTVAANMLTELVGNKHGTFNGTVTTGAGILPTNVNDEVTVDLDGGGQVLPKDPPPATTSKARFWGTRIGDATDIRMRVVKWNAPVPVANPADIVVDWQTVATGVQNNQTWIGELTGVPHGFSNYDCEVSWKDGSGNWTPAKRLNRRWSLGVSVGMAGQSILQTMRSTPSTTSRAFDPTVVGFMRAWYDIAQDSANNMDHSQPQGWLTRPGSSRTEWGENRMAEQLVLLTGSPVGVANCAVGGSSIGRFLGETKERWVRWKRFIQRQRPQVIIWGNGQGDYGMSRSQRHAALDQLFDQIDDAVQTAPGGPWNYQFYVFPLNGNWGSNDPDEMRSYDIEWARSRKAQGKPVDLLCTVLDETTRDGVHVTVDDAGHGLLASRMAQTIAHGVGLADYSGNGPEVDRASSSWSVNGSVTTVELVVNPNGGTSLVTAGGGAPSGFQLKIDNGGYAPPATAQIVSPTRIVLTANTPAASSVTVRYLAGGPGPTGGGAGTTKAQAGTDNAIYDNRGDITGLVPGFPMTPIPGADPLVLDSGSTTIFFDDFTDGNSAGWIENLSNQWNVVDDSGDNAYAWEFTWANQTGLTTAGSPAWANYRFSTDLKITNLLGWSETHLYARYGDADNYYRLQIQDRNGYHRLQMQKRVTGMPSDIGTPAYATLSAGVWYHVELRVSGNSLSAFLNGAPVIQLTDESIAEGGIGLGAWKQDVRFDNVEVASFTAGP